MITFCRYCDEPTPDGEGWHAECQEEVAQGAPFGEPSRLRVTRIATTAPEGWHAECQEEVAQGAPFGEPSRLRGGRVDDEAEAREARLAEDAERGELLTLRQEAEEAEEARILEEQALTEADEGIARTPVPLPMLRTAYLIGTSNNHGWTSVWEERLDVWARSGQGSPTLTWGEIREGVRDAHPPGSPMGIWPWPDCDGRIQHTTHTGRTSWTVSVDGSVQIDVYRLGVKRAVLRAVVDGPGGAVVLSRPAGPDHVAMRHGWTMAGYLSALGCAVADQVACYDDAEPDASAEERGEAWTRCDRVPQVVDACGDDARRGRQPRRVGGTTDQRRGRAAVRTMLRSVVREIQLTI